MHEHRVEFNRWHTHALPLCTAPQYRLRTDAPEFTYGGATAHDDQRCWIFHTFMTICDEKPSAANPIGPPTGGPVQGKLYYTYALQAFVSLTI